MDNSQLIEEEQLDWEVALQEIVKKDPDLARELETFRETVSAGHFIFLLGAFFNSTGISQTADWQKYWNAIQMKFGRPVYSVINNDIVFNELDGQSSTWIHRINDNRSNLLHHLPAIGRINVENHPRANWLGTGWFIQDDIIVTNRHVALEFATWDGGGYQFLNGIDDQPIKVFIDMLEEEGQVNDGKSVYALEEIIHIEPHGGPDIAFLRASHGPFPTAIKLSKHVYDNSDVVTIGYPGRWAPQEYEADMDRIYRGVYEKKRIAPGRIVSQSSNILIHDCCTLRGSSGSAVIDMETGNAVALHFAGKFFMRNVAVPGKLVIETFEKRLGEIII